MLQQLQATLAATRQEVASHQEALAGSQSLAESLRQKLDASEQDRKAQKAANEADFRLLQGQKAQLEQQLLQCKGSLEDAQAVTLMKQTQIHELQPSSEGELSIPLAVCTCIQSRARCGQQ